MSKLTAENLYLIKFDVKHLTPEIKQWREEGHSSYIAPCLNQCLYGREEDFDSFPIDVENDNHFRVERGEQAYRFLLETVSGFRSKDVGETHSRRQFIDGWRDFSSNNPDISKHYQKFVADVKKDSLHLQENILLDHKNTKRVPVVRDLSGQKKGDTVLVIGEVGTGDHIGGYGKDIIKNTENCQDPNGKMMGRNDFILLTHPDPVVMDVLRKEIADLQSRGEVRSNIVFTEFSDLSKHFEQCDRVYVDMAMGHDEIADQVIIDTWRDRVRQDNTLTHMRGDPKTMHESTGNWVEACDLKGIILPEDVTDEITVRLEKNNQVRHEFRGQAQTISELRCAGERNPLVAMAKMEQEADIDDATPE